MTVKHHFRKYRLFTVLPCFVIISTVFKLYPNGAKENGTLNLRQTSRNILSYRNDSLIQCIPSGINCFPPDFFSQEQRIQGGVLVHILIASYICAMIGIVCHKYFIPSLEIISERLKLPPDIAGATFMAIGTSAPELFSSILGSFVAKDDIGLGTIIGSAVFNIVGVTGVVGILLWNEVLTIDWYPMARDCTAYGITVLALIWIISDNIVTWWESLILLLIFFFYIFIIYFNKHIEACCRKMVSHERLGCKGKEAEPLLNEAVSVPEITEYRKPGKLERDSFSVEFTASKENEILGNGFIPSLNDSSTQDLEDNTGGTLCTSPNRGCGRMLWWFFMYPCKVLFFLTIPDSNNQRCKNLFVLTFIMSIIWIGVLSYLAVWMVTIIGYTFSVPDSVSGLTVLAAGTSVPEIITSTIVAKNGQGNMAISNLVGSNTFDISFCLGSIWLLKTLTSETKYLLVYSSALTYTAATLLITLLAFVLVFVFSNWKMNRTTGMVFLTIYGIFVLLACLYEMNVFGEINVKPCDY